MKKNFSKIFAMVMAVCMLAGMITVMPATAASETVTYTEVAASDGYYAYFDNIPSSSNPQGLPNQVQLSYSNGTFFYAEHFWIAAGCSSKIKEIGYVNTTTRKYTKFYDVADYGTSESGVYHSDKLIAGINEDPGGSYPNSGLVTQAVRIYEDFVICESGSFKVAAKLEDGTFIAYEWTITIAEYDWSNASASDSYIFYLDKYNINGEAKTAKTNAQDSAGQNEYIGNKSGTSFEFVRGWVSIPEEVEIAQIGYINTTIGAVTWSSSSYLRTEPTLVADINTAFDTRISNNEVKSAKRATIDDSKAVFSINNENCAPGIYKLSIKLTTGQCICYGGFTFELQGYGIASQSVTIENNLNLYVTATVFPTPAAAPTMTFTRNGHTTEKLAPVSGSDGTYTFCYEGINSQCMADEITINLYDSEGELKDTKTTSIKAYCEKLYETYNAASDTTYNAIIADLLEYGAVSQLYKGYNTANLANANETLAANKTVVSDAPATDYTRTGDSTTTKFTGASLYLDNQVDLVIKFANGDSAELYVGGTKVTAEDGSYTLTVAPADFDKVYTFTLKDGETTYSTLTYSVNTYIRSKWSSAAKKTGTGTLGSLVQAMYALNQSCNVLQNAA